MQGSKKNETIVLDELCIKHDSLQAESVTMYDIWISLEYSSIV